MPLDCKRHDISKVNEKYESLTIGPEGSNVSVNARLDKAFNDYLGFEIGSPTNLRKTREILMNVWIYENDYSSNGLEEIYMILKHAGYYDLTVYDFIKHMADKRGAHIDIEIVPLVKILNDASGDGWTPVKSYYSQYVFCGRIMIR